MPLAQPTVVAFLTGEVAGLTMEAKGIPERDVRIFQAFIAVGAGLATAATTVDPAGGLLIALIAILYANGYEHDAGLLQNARLD